jgi:FixJ family two-component response regulator
VRGVGGDDRRELVRRGPSGLHAEVHEFLADGRHGSLRARYKALTAREREVLALVAAGLLNKVIADRLGIAEATIKVHRGRVMERMGAASLADLVRISERLGVAPGADPPRR